MISISNLNYIILRLGVLFLILIGIFVFVTLSIVIFAKKFNCEEKLFNGRVFSFLGKRKDFKHWSYDFFNTYALCDLYKSGYKKHI